MDLVKKRKRGKGNSCQTISHWDVIWNLTRSARNDWLHVSVPLVNRNDVIESERKWNEESSRCLNILLIFLMDVREKIKGFKTHTCSFTFINYNKMLFFFFSFLLQEWLFFDAWEIFDVFGWHLLKPFGTLYDDFWYSSSFYGFSTLYESWSKSC